MRRSHSIAIDGEGTPSRPADIHPGLLNAG